MRCNICGSSNFIDMKPRNDSIFVRKGVKCEHCGSLERTRLYFEVINKYGILKKKSKIFHVAPEISVGKYLRKFSGNRYMACDINPERYHKIGV